MRVFISYSHNDEKALKQLRKHCANLERSGDIKTWYDHDILAGSELDVEIEQELKESELFLLMVSPDFIASDYCINREMKFALERQSAGNARVVSVIVEECDWKAIDGLRQLKVLPKDGKPISLWDNQNKAYKNVVDELRRIIKEKNAPTTISESKSKPDAKHAATSRYRIKRDFDEFDRKDFRDSAFATIKDHFQREIEEIDSIDGLRGKFKGRKSTAFGATVENTGKSNATAYITVHCGDSRAYMNDIYYSFEKNAPDNLANGWFDVSQDDYKQFLTHSIDLIGNADKQSTPQQAANKLWRDFISIAGINPD